MRIQFGRLCKLEFTNLTTKKKFTIDQSLRISFEFLKSFDESTTSSTGKIIIHGLTQETAEKLGDRIGNNYQTEVKCSVGYAGDIGNFQTLFYGVVTYNKWTRKMGTSETEIGVSANARLFELGSIVSTQLVNTTLGEIFLSLETLFGFGFDFILPTEYEDRNSLASAIKDMRVLNWSFTGNLKDYLQKISKTFNLIYISEQFDNGDKIITFSIDQIAYSAYFNAADKKAQGKTATFDVGYKPPEDKKEMSLDIKRLFLSEDNKNAVVLSFETGLLETPYLDNRNIKVPFNSKLNENETIVESKGITVKRSKKTGEALVDKKTGKVKTKVPKTMTINRRFLTAKAQLNPSIKPQSMIKIESHITKVDGIYRARNCKFVGDTHQGDWTVEMELEDTAQFDPEVKSGVTDENTEVEVFG